MEIYFISIYNRCCFVQNSQQYRKYKILNDVSDCIRYKPEILQNFRFSEQRAVFKNKLYITKLQLFCILFTHCFNYPSFSPLSFLISSLNLCISISALQCEKPVACAFLKLRQFSAMFFFACTDLKMDILSNSNTFISWDLIFMGPLWLSLDISEWLVLFCLIYVSYSCS